MNRLLCFALFAAIFVFSGCYTQIAQNDPEPKSHVVIVETYEPQSSRIFSDWNLSWLPDVRFYYYYPHNLLWDATSYWYPLSFYSQYIYYDPYFEWYYTYYPPQYWYGWHEHLWSYSDYPYTPYWRNHYSLSEKYYHAPTIRNFGSTHGKTPLGVEPRRNPQRDANSKNPQNPQVRSRWQQKFNIAIPPGVKRTPQQTPQRKKNDDPQIRNNGNTRTPPQRDVRPPRQQQQTNPPERKPGRRP